MKCAGVRFVVSSSGPRLWIGPGVVGQGVWGSEGHLWGSGGRLVENGFEFAERPSSSYGSLCWRGLGIAPLVVRSRCGRVRVYLRLAPRFMG